MQITPNTKRFVSFDNAGRIEQIGNAPVEGCQYLELNFDDVKQVLEGRDSIARWRVIYDYLEKKYVIKHKKDIEKDEQITGFIYEVPTNETDAQVVIEQDNIKKCWRLKVSDEVKLDTSISPYNQVYSITKKYDPNVLYKSLVFDKENPTIDFDYEFDNVDISVYTTRRFSSYQHEVINGK